MRASPSTKDAVHHGIASSASPAAEKTRASISQRRSRTIGCATAANASSNAIDALNAGWNVHWPVSSAPGDERNAVTVKNTP